MQAQRQTVSIFDTVPNHNYLGFFEGENASEKIVTFLKLSKEEVANATGIPKASIRYDNRIPEELMRRLQEIGNVCELVAGYFKGNTEKTALWFNIKNPALGNLSPREMILYGRYQKLIKFIQNALAGYNP